MAIQSSECIEEIQRICCGCLVPKTDNGNIKNINVSRLSDEELNKMCYHFSLKINQPFIDKNGLVAKIGRNSDGEDEEKYIFFSYGLQGVVELWDYWLKWRANRLFSPWYQKEYKDIIEALTIRNGKSVSIEKQNSFFSKNGIKWVKNGSRKELTCQWEEDFISGVYKTDEEKMKALFDFQIVELISSNYYSLDLIEGEDFSFDEIDLKKKKWLSWDPNSINYKVYTTMINGHSDLGTIKVDRWNMTTKLGKKITVTPERIKQLISPNDPDDALRILVHLYDRYKRITPKEQQAETELLDSFIQYVKLKERNKELKSFSMASIIRDHEMLKSLHNQKDFLDFSTSCITPYSSVQTPPFNKRDFTARMVRKNTRPQMSLDE